MKKSSETLGLKVMGIKEGLENGTAQDLMIDASKRTVEYLILKDNSGYGFRAIATKDILGIGTDYIMTPTIENAKKIYCLLYTSAGAAGEKQTCAGNGKSGR